MRRAFKLALLVLVVLIALGIVNALVLDNQTKPAEVTADGGKIETVSSVDLQVFDSPATGPGPEGAPIVLLHCFGCSSQWRNPILDTLNERHRVVRIDLIGHGGSEKPQSGYEIKTQAAAAAEALNSLGIQGATVVGHSLGGIVAASLAEQASELVDRVVLIGVPSESGEADLPLTEKLTRVPVLGQGLWRLARRDDQAGLPVRLRARDRRERGVPGRSRPGRRGQPRDDVRLVHVRQRRGRRLLRSSPSPRGWPRPACR